jgi:predicted dehydrogenase
MKPSRRAARRPSQKLSRRKFMLTSGAAAAAFTIVPRHVLGGPGFVAPSEKITLAYIGCGTQGLREMPALLALPDIQIVAVCDPVEESYDYVDWSKDGLRSELASFLTNPGWRRNNGGIPGGREVARDVIQTYYANARRQDKFKGCNRYADFRELLDKEPDLNAVKIMTPDHLHATIAIAAMKRGKHVLMHKPLANRLLEARAVVETARHSKSKLATHFLPANDGSNIRMIKGWIDSGTIGTLREIHNWSNRPVWPQYPTLPTDSPPVPKGFDWQLWLGPSLDRPYHPNYTHAVFRGWYEFGGGALADMGHYSLWPVFQTFELDAPTCVESRPSHLCTQTGRVPARIKNDYSFPAACTIRFRFAAKNQRPAIDIFWYDGSMKPPTPDELGDNHELEPEGMMFIGDKGKILAGFRGESPRVLGNPAFGDPTTSPRQRPRSEALALWVAAAKGGKPTYGDFTLAGPISDAFNLAAVSLRTGGKRLFFDSSQAKITNLPNANKYLTREYRKGWEMPAA